MNFAVTFESLGDDVRAAADAARALGFTAVVARVQSRGADLTQLSASGVREYLHLLSSRSLRLAALQYDLPPAGLHPRADIDREISRLDRAVAAAATLERTVVVCDLGALPPARAEPVAKPAITPEQAGAIIIPAPKPVAPAPPAEAPDPAFESTFDSALREIARSADRNGVVLAIRSSLSPFAALARALNEVSCPWFGVDLDPIAMLADSWESDEIFSRLGGLVRHVRGRDGVRGSHRAVPTEMGKGQVDWATLLANLDAVGYGGAISIDTHDLPDRAAAAARALNVLRRHAGRQ